MSKWIQVWGKESGDTQPTLMMSFPVMESLEDCRQHAEAAKKMMEHQGVTDMEIKEVEQDD